MDMRIGNGHFAPGSLHVRGDFQDSRQGTIGNMSTTALMTVEQLIQLLPVEDGQNHELLEGEHLVSPYPKSGHGRLQRRLALVLDTQSPEGVEAFVEMGYLLSEYTYLKPDVSLTKPEQVRDTQADDWFRGSPAIAVEVVSLSNSAREIARRVKAYFRYGGQEVWVVYPKKRQIHVHEPAGLTHRYENSVRSIVLPNLTLDLDELFRGLF